MAAERADVTVSLAAGGAGASLVVPATTAWLLSTRGVDIAALATVLGGSTLLTLTAIAFWRYGAGIPERIGGTSARYLLALVPLVPLLSIPTLGPAMAVRSVLVLGGIFGVLATLLFVLTCQTRHSNAVTPDDAVSWTAAPPERIATRRRYLGVTAFAVGITFFAGGVVTGTRTLQYVGQWLVPVAAAVTVLATRTSTYATGRAGLTRSTHVHAVTRSWRRFRGYSVSDDAIVLHRASRWQWLPPRRFAQSDLEDPDNSIAALDRYLERE